MTDSTRTTPPLYRFHTGAAIGAIVAGLVVVVLAVGFGWSGLAGGFALGGGVGLALIGAYLWGYGNGRRRPGAQALPAWLPSRDPRG